MAFVVDFEALRSEWRSVDASGVTLAGHDPLFRFIPL
jgi:hypothetical protein